MRILIIRRSWLTAALCVCASSLMLWVVAHPAAIGAAAEQRALPVYSVEVQGGEQVAAITFDAAWDDVRMRQFRLVSELPHFYCFFIRFYVSDVQLDGSVFGRFVGKRSLKQWSGTPT